MRTVVRFDAAGATYAAPVEHVREVVPAQGIVLLPAARDHVAGVIRRDEGTLTVLTVLAPSGDHILVLDDGVLRFGLIVDRVTAVQQLEESRIGDPPSGQDGGIVTGVVDSDEGVVLLVDLFALAGRLLA